MYGYFRVLTVSVGDAFWADWGPKAGGIKRCDSEAASHERPKPNRINFGQFNQTFRGGLHVFDELGR